MEARTHAELPDRHLLNLSPQPQKTQYQAYRADYNYRATERSSIPIQRNSHQVPPLQPASRVSTEAMVQKARATKVPVASSIPERAKDQRNQTPSPTGIPKPPSSATLSSVGAATPSPGSERDQYWKKLRDRFEKGSPLSQRTSYHRTRASNKKLASVQADDMSQSDQMSSRGASPRSAIPSPKSSIPSPSSSDITRGATASRHIPSPQTEGQKRWRKANGSWVSLESQDLTLVRSDKAEHTTEPRPHSRCPSISPISDDSSVTDGDWEDRFVVHMPSARDPNPPTMTAEEISNYQINISLDKARKYDQLRRSPRLSHTKQSPGNGEQEKSKTLTQYGTYDGSYAQPQQVSEKQQLAPPPYQTESPNDGNYYSPDEIGKNRISTIWEESPTRSSKDKRVSQNPDGSFLGCKEISGPTATNPDDVILFASGEDSTTLQPRPLAIGAKKRLKEKTSRGPRKSEEKVVSPDEGRRTSQSSSRAPCSRRSSATLCQDPNYPQRETKSPDSLVSSKENARPEAETEKQAAKHFPEGTNEDDVFIITPTITRTLIPTPNTADPVKAEKEKKGFMFKPQGLRRPGGIGSTGTGEAVKAVRAKPQVISTPSMLRPMIDSAQKKSTAPSLASSKSNERSKLPTPAGQDTDSKSKEAERQDKDKNKESPAKVEKSASNSIRGFIRTTGLAKSTSIKSPSGGLATILRNGTESLRNRAESLRNGSGSFNGRKGSPVSLPTRDNSESGRSERSFKSAKESTKDTPPPSTRATPVKKTNIPSKLATDKKSTSVDTSPVDSTDEQTHVTKSPKMEKDKKTCDSPPPVEKGDNSPKPEKLSRSERLEKFKEQARLRRAAKTNAKTKSTEKPVEIAELDGEQVPPAKDDLQPNITNVEELRDLPAEDKDQKIPDEVANTLALSLIFEIIFLTITNIHKLALQLPNSPYIKFLVNNVSSMTTHCFDVFNCIYNAITVYQATGKWPKPRSDQAISRFLVEFLQALVYLVILGLGALCVGRAAGYAYLVGSWILWLARPVAWTFHCMTRLLIS